MSDGPTPPPVEEPHSEFLEAVAKAVAFCHYARGARSPKFDRIEELADRNWRDFEHDARMIIEVINKMVERQAFEEAVAELPQLPAFLSGVMN